MRKSYNHSVEIVNNRNELVDAMEGEKAVIEIQGELYKEMEDEIIQEFKNTRTADKLTGALGIVSGLEILIASAIPPLAIAQFALAIVLNRQNSKKAFYKYNLFVFTHEGITKFFLIHKAYDAKLDSITGYEDFVFTKGKTCPACKTKISKELLKTGSPVLCDKCKKTIIR